VDDPIIAYARNYTTFSRCGEFYVEDEIRQSSHLTSMRESLGKLFSLTGGALTIYALYKLLDCTSFARVHFHDIFTRRVAGPRGPGRSSQVRAMG
jgi:hypothetical protein